MNYILQMFVPIMLNTPIQMSRSMNRKVKEGVRKGSSTHWNQLKRQLELHQLKP